MRRRLARERFERVPPILVGALIGAGWMGVAAALANNSDWKASSWFAAVSGLFVFLVALWLSRQQSELQKALANLELREKIGVINGQGNEITDPKLRYRAYYFFGDFAASLALFDKAAPLDQEKYVTAVSATIARVKEHVFDGPSPACDRLYELAAELHEMLADGTATCRAVERCKAGGQLLETLSALRDLRSPART